MVGRTSTVASAGVNDAIRRATGILLFIAVAAIHFVQIVPTTEDTPLLGTGFVMLIAACLVVAVGLEQNGSRYIWTAGAAVSAVALLGYAFTRIFNTPIDNQDVGNWSCMLGMAALFLETFLLAFSLYAARPRRSVRSLVARISDDRAGWTTPGDPSAA